MQRAGRRNVIDETPTPAKQRRVLNAAHPLTDPASCCRLCHCLPRV